MKRYTPLLFLVAALCVFAAENTSLDTYSGGGLSGYSDKSGSKIRVERSSGPGLFSQGIRILLYRMEDGSTGVYRKPKEFSLTPYNALVFQAKSAVPVEIQFEFTTGGGKVRVGTTIDSPQWKEYRISLRDAAKFENEAQGTVTTYNINILTSGMAVLFLGELQGLKGGAEAMEDLPE